MKFTSIFLILFINVIDAEVYAQPSWSWAKAIGGIDYEYGGDIAVDLNGDFYLVGSFEDSTDLDPGPGEFIIYGVPGSSDGFIAKYDFNGNLIWGFGIGNGGPDYFNTVEIFPNGEIIVTGVFYGSVDFDPDINKVSMLTSLGARDICILKISSNGELIWAKSIGGTMEDDANDVIIDSLFNIYIAGSFNGIADLDPDLIISRSYISAGWDAFLLKLDSAGQYIWSIHIGGPSTDVIYSISLNGLNEIVTAGNFGGVVDFNPDSTNVDTLVSNGNIDVFFAVYDSNGIFKLARNIGGTLSEASYAMCTDIQDNIILTGTFDGTIDLDPSDSSDYILSSVSHDLFVAMYSPAGDFIWGNHINSTVNIFAESICTDNQGNIYMTGSFSGTVDLDPGPGSSLVNSSSIDLYIYKIDSSGNLSWAESPSENGDEYGSKVIYTASGSLFFVGSFESQTFQLSSMSVYNNSTFGTSDIVLAKIDYVTGLTSENQEKIFSIYPIPAAGFINVEMELLSSDVNLVVTDALGRVSYKQIAASGMDKFSIDVSDLANGIYFLSAYSENGIQVRRFLVSR